MQSTIDDGTNPGYLGPSTDTGEEYTWTGPVEFIEVGGGGGVAPQVYSTNFNEIGDTVYVPNPNMTKPGPHTGEPSRYRTVVMPSPEIYQQWNDYFQSLNADQLKTMSDKLGVGTAYPWIFTGNLLWKAAAAMAKMLGAPFREYMQGQITQRLSLLEFEDQWASDNANAVDPVTQWENVLMAFASSDHTPEQLDAFIAQQRRMIVGSREDELQHNEFWTNLLDEQNANHHPFDPDDPDDPDDPFDPDDPEEPIPYDESTRPSQNYYPVPDYDYSYAKENTLIDTGPEEIKDKNAAWFRDPGNPGRRGRRGNRRPRKSRRGGGRRRRGSRSRGRGQATGQQLRSYPMPAAMPTMSANTTQPVVTYGRDSLTIHHREPWVELACTTTDAKITLPNNGIINPGFSFLWASRFASMFEKYKVNAIKLEYMNNLSYATGGIISMAFDPDPDDDSVVTSPLEIRSMVPSVTGPIYHQLELPVATRYYNTPAKRFVRFSDAPPAATYDIHNYDIGRFYVSAFNAGGSANVGFLFVEYDITFYNPHVMSDPSPLVSDKLVTSSCSRTTPFANPTWASTPTSLTAISITGWKVSSTSRLACSNPGQWLMEVEIDGTVIASMPSSGAGITPATGVTVTLLKTLINAASTQAIGIYTVKFDRLTNGYFDVDYTAHCTTMTASVIRFTHYNSVLAKPTLSRAQLLNKDVIVDSPDSQDDVEEYKESPIVVPRRLSLPNNKILN